MGSEYPVVPGLVHRLTIQLWAMPVRDVYRGVVTQVRVGPEKKIILDAGDRMKYRELLEYEMSWDLVPGPEYESRYSTGHSFEWVAEDSLDTEKDFQWVIHETTVICK